MSRITDLSFDTDMYHPVYAIYENDVPTRIVGFNYVNDPTGANTYQLTLNGLSAPQVFVRYLTAPTISEQYNITWANQTMGTSFASDGTLSGTVSTITINCNNGQCVVPIPAPAIALIFLTAQAETESTADAGATTTYATTVVGTGSATMNPQVLETSNGQNGPDGMRGSTSSGQTVEVSGAKRIRISGVGVILGLVGWAAARTSLA